MHDAGCDTVTDGHVLEVDGHDRCEAMLHHAEGGGFADGTASSHTLINYNYTSKERQHPFSTSSWALEIGERDADSVGFINIIFMNAAAVAIE